jgi:hypothetical protein
MLAGMFSMMAFHARRLAVIGIATSVLTCGATPVAQSGASAPLNGPRGAATVAANPTSDPKVRASSDDAAVSRAPTAVALTDVVPARVPEAPLTAGSGWVDDAPEPSWFRVAVAYMRDDGLTLLIVVLILVGLGWLLWAITTYLRLSMAQSHAVRSRGRRRHRSHEHRSGASTTREHRRRRHSRPSP